MTLVRYLSRVVILRILAVLLALTALVQLIETLEALRRIFGTAGGVTTLLIYLALKFPMVIERLFPLAMLIGSVTAFHVLARSSEMAILRAAGLSPYRFLAALLPVMALCGAVNYALVDRLAPVSEQDFAEWWNDVSRQTDTAEEPQDPLWLRAGGEVVSIGRILDDGRRLENVSRYLRDDLGRLTAVSRADVAIRDKGVWRLGEETLASADNGSVAKYSGRIWANGPSVENLQELTLHVERLSGAKARQVLAGDWSGSEGAAHYHIILHRTYAALFLPFVMMLLAVPALHGGRRTGKMAWGVGVSLSLGLAYIVVNGIFLSMGEAAAIPPALAVWAAPAAFAFIGMATLLHFEE